MGKVVGGSQFEFVWNRSPEINFKGSAIPFYKYIVYRNIVKYLFVSKFVIYNTHILRLGIFVFYFNFIS